MKFTDSQDLISSVAQKLIRQLWPDFQNCKLGFFFLSFPSFLFSLVLISRLGSACRVPVTTG